MNFKKPVIRTVGSLLVALALTLGGCSKDKVKAPPSVTDTQLESTTKPKKKLAKGSQYDTLWDRLFALYALPHVENSDVDREVRWFENHPGYIERAQSRAEPFLFSIVKLIEKQEVPGEIALLPIVESAFQPHVVSPARAAGIWQFIPSTGTHYGLKRSSSYDGRRDVYASTKAAIKYLKKLNSDFGDWLLAIAAYNCGEGTVSRAIRRNEAAGLPTDFWSLNLPQETRAYVPRLLAISRIFADSEKYGINLKDMPNSAQFKPVKVSSQVDLALAAEAAGISLEQLQQLNPGFRGQFADVPGSYHLFIPAHKKAADFRQEVERLSLARGLGSTASDSATPDPGSFDSFRRDIGRSSSATASDDASGQEPRRARTYLKLPDLEVDNSDSARSANQSRRGNSDEGGGHRKTHQVLRGETLFSVARKYGMDTKQLAKLNNLTPKTEVQAGQKLIISESEVSSDEGGSGRGHGKSSRHSSGGHYAAKAYHSDKPERSDKSSKSGHSDSHKSSTHGHDAAPAPKSANGKKGSKKK